MAAPDEETLRAAADELDDREFTQWLLERPAYVEALLAGTDWSEVAPDVLPVFRTIYQGQQEVLAAGGGRLTLTFDDYVHVVDLTP